MELLNLLRNFDKEITLFLKNIIPRNIIFDYFFSFLSFQGSSILIWIIIVLFLIFIEEKKHPGISKKDKKFIFLFFSSLILSIIISEIILKNIFKRERPFFYKIKNFKLSQLNYSFPSTHSTIAFSSAIVLSFFDRKRRFFYYMLALLIGYSRIYLGVHYFFDVIFGFFIGIMISKLLIKITFKK